jgi:hypothetical protein
MLGFWVSLFDAKYERQFWHGPNLKRVFPYAPNSELGCHKVRARLNRIRHLRNRVFLHEPVFHWGNLKQLHAETLLVISWLSADWYRAIVIEDRFDLAHSVGHNHIQDRLLVL